MTEYNVAGQSLPTHFELEHRIFGHPDDVIKDVRLSTSQKRALLASWASDANAVPHIPALRQLPDGSIVQVGEILHALKSLDRADGSGAVNHNPRMVWQRPFSRIRKPNQVRRRRRPDDDDDPPPYPACAALPPRISGGGCLVVPEQEVVAC